MMDHKPSKNNYNPKFVSFQITPNHYKELHCEIQRNVNTSANKKMRSFSMDVLPAFWVEFLGYFCKQSWAGIM